MKPYHVILVGVTYTAACEFALRQAHQIAQKSGAKLLAFHAVRPVEIDEVVKCCAIERDLMIDSAQNSLEAFVERALGSNHHVTCLVNEGEPYHEFSNLANESGADLVIIGADHFSNSTRDSGNFSIKSLRSFTMPVLLVREQPNRPFARLSACIDFSKSTTPVLEHTARLDFNENQFVEIVHASCTHGSGPSPLRFLTGFFSCLLYTSPSPRDRG